jgi:cytochrome c oxidase subunit 2
VRRGAVTALLCLTSLAACGSESAARHTDGVDDPNATVISVVAQRWQYTPGEITLKKGVPIVFEITSADVHHGFNLPELGVRADAIPGQKTRLPFTPEKTGTFTFRCDYFCGDGHEDMQGVLTVE